MGWPIILGCWHISQPRRGLLFKACPLLSEVSAYDIHPNWQIYCFSRHLEWQPCHHGVSVCSCREARASTFLAAKPPSCHAIGTPLLLGGDWNCVAEDMSLVGAKPGTRQHGFQLGLLPFQQALSLQDAFRCLHPQAKEFTHTATNNASSARIDRWLVSESLLPNVSAASVTDLILSDHYGVAVSVSPANAPPRGPGLWSMPPAIISHPELKTLMTTQIQTFLQANPQVSAAQSDGTSSGWTFKMLLGTIAPHSMPSVQGSSECSGYEPARLERPMWQLQAVIMP